MTKEALLNLIAQGVFYPEAVKVFPQLLRGTYLRLGGKLKPPSPRGRRPKVPAPLVVPPGTVDPPLTEARKTFPRRYDKGKAKATNLERYGVEYFSQTEAARALSRKKMQEVHERGLSSSGKNKKYCPDVARLKELCAQGVSSEEISKVFGVSLVTMTRWFKDYSIVKGCALRSRMPSWTDEQLQGDYLEACKGAGRSLSFHEYGKARSRQALCLRIQRLCQRRPELREILRQRGALQGGEGST